MSEIKDGLLYTKEDEWLLVDGDSASIGVTDYAQDSLSDIVYLELPSEGDNFDAEDTFRRRRICKSGSGFVYAHQW